MQLKNEFAIDDDVERAWALLTVAGGLIGFALSRLVFGRKITR